MAKKNKRPTDLNQRAKSIVDIATGEVEETQQEKDEIKAAASALGRKGGLKGGPARKAALTPKRLKEIAQLGAAARWRKAKD